MAQSGRREPAPAGDICAHRRCTLGYSFRDATLIPHLALPHPGRTAVRMNATSGHHVLPVSRLGDLFSALRSAGWNLAGPRIRDGAIVYDELETAADLPAGWTDEQAPGKYGLKKRGDGALFGYVVGPHSWKKYLFPPTVRMWSATKTADGMEVEVPQPAAPPTAFIGVRACELAAIAVQDKVFLGSGFVDPVYKARRDNIFLVAVNCGQAGGTCFCSSMNTGPKARGGFDIALTEILEDGHRFLLESGSERGERLVALLAAPAASDADRSAADAAVARAVSMMGRTMETSGVKELLQRNYEHPRWDHVAARCLACTNCTMVCPTCFCSTVEDVPNLSLDRSDHVRTWDSCFTSDFSYIHGGSVRPSVKSRYRQWMVHKLSTWHDQFASSGCVGCGRCITWCPTGIDITEEVREIRASDGANT